MAAALVVLLVGGLGTPSAAASSSGVAGARGDLRRAEEQLTALNVRLSLYAQEVHQGKVLLATLRSDLAAARRRSERAKRAAAAAASELDATVRRAYEGVGTTSGLAALIGMRSVSDFLQGVDFLSALAQRNSQAATSAGTTRERAQDTLDQMASLAAAQARALKNLRVAQNQMQSAIAAQRRLIGQLEHRLKRSIELRRLRRIALAVSSRAATDPGPGSPGGAPPPPGPPPPPENKVDALIYSIWGHSPDGGVAECIADHESHDNPNARNGGSGAAGLFQLMPFWWDGNNAFGWKFDPYDAQANAEHAHLIWKRDGWSPWTTRPLCT